MKRYTFVCILGCLWFSVLAQAAPQYALSKYGDVKYPADFTHFDYTNPNAPKGGSLRLGAIGTFDSFNAFILKGVSEPNLALTYDTLMKVASDEASTHYGLIAESVELDPENNYVIFNLRPQAKFQDGQPITADDVVYTFNLLTEHGHPVFRSYYQDVKQALVLSSHRVRFDFNNNKNLELPLILSELMVLPKHYWESRDFSNTTLEPPLGSGPYKIGRFEQGRYVVYERDPNYWAKDLPVNRGFYNFDEIRFDYYRDSRIALEALKAGEYDLRVENISKQWATGYDIAAVKDGVLKKIAIDHQKPTGMQAFAFNTRRDIFKDKQVRHALSLLFDFEWTNRNLFYDAYNRTQSYFSNSELAFTPTLTAEEKQILDVHKDKIDPTTYNPMPFELPVTKGDGQVRDLQRKALRLLQQSGWVIKNNQLVNAKTGKVFEFEFLLDSPSFERVVLPYVKNLEKLGIKVNVRTVDAAQYQKRVEKFDFDMTVILWGSSLTPGNELKVYWSSDAAQTKGSLNYPGIANPVVDELIDKIIYATSWHELLTLTHVLDRILLSEYYVIPHWHIRNTRVAYWDKLAFPAVSPAYDFVSWIYTWWVEPERDAKIKQYLKK